MGEVVEGESLRRVDWSSTQVYAHARARICMGTDSHMHTYTHQGHEGMFQASVHKYIHILALGYIWTQAHTCTHIHIAVNLQEVSQQSFTTFDSKFHHYTHTCTPTHMYTLR